MKRSYAMAVWGVVAWGVWVLAGRPAVAATYYVRPDGNDQAAGTSAGESFRTILQAAARLNHGDGILIAPGVYRQSVLLAERFSADGAAMSIAGDESGKAFGVAGGAVVIEPARPAGAALHLVRFRNVQVSGLTFRGPGQGLHLDRCRGVLVERCTFDGLTRGLAAEGVEDLRVESCVFARCTIGLSCQHSVRARVAHASIVGCSTAGLLVLGCGEGAVRNSLLAANNTNLIADRISAAAWSSDHNVLHGPSGPWGDVPVVANAYEWQAASGQDRHSVYIAPALASAAGGDLHILPAVGWGGGLPGMDAGEALTPRVEMDRDGRAFGVRAGRTCVGAYDYGQPAPTGGWVRLGVKLTGGPRQSAGIYREDGTLMRTLLADAAGVAELWWDGLDDLGQPAPVGRYIAKAVCGDVRVVDDGAFGDDGNPLGAYNCDNADRVAALDDGGFIITTIYDEAGYPLRRYAASGQCTFAANLAEKDFAAVAGGGEDLYAAVGKGAAAAVVRLRLPGHRARMANGAAGYRIFGEGEKPAPVAGLAVVGGKVFVSLSGADIVRVMDLADGHKVADWPLPGAADLAADAKGTIWAISGTDVVALDGEGKAARRFATQLPTPRYLAISPTLLGVVDRKSRRLAVLNATDGMLVRSIGKPPEPGQWAAVGPDALRDPRGAAFLTDGRLALTEHARIRILWPRSGRVSQDLLSNFMDVAVPHPTRREYVYCSPGIFRVDPATGAWRWLVESPGGPPSAHAVAGGPPAAAALVIPKVAGLKLDGGWSAWAAAGARPQILCLPVVGFRRNVPDDLWQTFRQGTAIGAIAHDGRSLWAYFVVADDTPRFDAAAAGRMWEFDSVELWLEEEQIGLGMVRDGTPALFKYRHHNRAGKEWSAGYALSREDVSAAKLADLSAHPLGRELAAATGASMAGRAGYAVAGRIPFEEVKLVGGIAGRGGKDILNLTGKAGEVLRVGVNFGGVTDWGREQDFKVNWPSALMFSDPTRSAPFVMGP